MDGTNAERLGGVKDVPQLLDRVSKAVPRRDTQSPDPRREQQTPRVPEPIGARIPGANGLVASEDVQVPVIASGEPLLGPSLH